jgi:Flp pilus assembly protein TadD
MSLLLDALKKAASEKEKNKSAEKEATDQQAPISNEIQQNEIEESEVLDLDLDVPDENNKSPEVDENIEFPGETVEEPEVEVEVESNDAHVIDDASNDTEELEDVIEINEEPEDEIFEKEEEIKPEKNQPAIQPVVKKASGVKNKEVLSELINKSNKHSRRKKLQVKIIIASLLVILFLGTSLYLYIEFSADSQNIYVEDKPNKPINRSVVQKNSPVKNNKRTNAIESKIENPKKAMVSEVDQIKKKQSRTKAQATAPKKRQKIEIVHKVVRDPVEGIVRQGYEAFKQQDYKASERLYKKANKAEPNNRDALLGLAAIASKQQRYEFARQKYLQLRYLNPKDSLAIAGLSAIQNKINSELSESELKFMLREQPESAHLYFALGSIYATQKKWADAQSSFFSAWSAENTNADYAFNLAVSLDQLGKKTQAKQLYELSLKLDQTNKGNFSKETVEKRIKILNENKNRK